MACDHNITLPCDHNIKLPWYIYNNKLPCDNNSNCHVIISSNYDKIITSNCHVIIIYNMSCDHNIELSE